MKIPAGSCVSGHSLRNLSRWLVGNRMVGYSIFFLRVLVYPNYQGANCAVFIYALNESPS